MNNYESKMVYLNEILLPNLEKAFKRGDKKYVGNQHSHTPRILFRTAVEDIKHIRELHVGVRLREAEECADNDKLSDALKKIESAIGYLVILHMRISYKHKEWDEIKGSKNITGITD